MPVPGFQEIMLPLLRLAGRSGEHRVSEAVEELASEFGLTQDQRDELLPSGRQSRWTNRVGWAKTYLSKAQLIRSSGRATFEITDRGKEALALEPQRIDLPFLMRYQEIRDFRTPSNSAESVAPSEDTGAAPEEIIETAFAHHNTRIIDELLERVKQVTPTRFEAIVLDVLTAMGYGGLRPDAAEHLGRSGDGGVDGVINEDPLGLDVVYVQAKRWEASVGRPDVQGFAGSLEGQRARKGVFITTSNFSQEAKEYVRFIEKRIVLIDGKRLCELMLTHGVGVATVETYPIRKIALDYFEEA